MIHSESTRAGNVSYTVRCEGRPIILLHTTLHNHQGDGATVGIGLLINVGMTLSYSTK